MLGVGLWRENALVRLEAPFHGVRARAAGGPPLAVCTGKGHCRLRLRAFPLLFPGAWGIHADVAPDSAIRQLFLGCNEPIEAETKEKSSRIVWIAPESLPGR